MKALDLLSRKEKRRGLLVLAMVVFMALLETAGVASVMPFLAVLGNTQLVETNPALATLYALLNLQNIDAFMMFLGMTAFGLVLFSAVIRILTNYVMNGFIEMRRHSIGERLLETYLRQPYEFFLDHHSADLAKNILSEVDQVIANVYRPGMQMIAYGVVVLALIALLVAVDPVIAGIVALVIGTTYGLIFLTVRGLLGRIGHDRLVANRERFTAASEALGGIKDIKLLGREQAYLARFRGPSIRHARHQATKQTLSTVPKYLIEAIGFGGILALTLILMATSGGATDASLGDVLPILGLYAFAGYRILPAAQQLYSAFANFRFGAAGLDSVYDDLRQRMALAHIPKQAPERLIPQRLITLDAVTYTYPNATHPALREIALEIPVGQSIGLVGSTGSGKTTLVDVLLGLLRPTTGRLKVDDETVTDDTLRAWQQTLGYVPQDIFLTDATVAENIALGIPTEHIDHAQVKHSARIANLHDFVFHEMPRGYDTLVGERGVRLSGGQRQRIGIARALYHRPKVLIMDEATSALDNLTEQAVMEAVQTLSHKITIILIAHRLSTVRACDQIYLLEQGRLVGQGSYDELNINNARFRHLALAAHGA